MCVHIENSGVWMKALAKTLLRHVAKFWETLIDGIRSRIGEAQTLFVASSSQTGDQVLFVLLWNPSLKHKPQWRAQTFPSSQKSNSDYGSENRKELVSLEGSPTPKRSSTSSDNSPVSSAPADRANEDMGLWAWYGGGENPPSAQQVIEHCCHMKLHRN